MKISTLFLFFIFFCTGAVRSGIEDQFCDSEYTEKRMSSNWKMVGKKLCAEAECSNGQKFLKRQRCITQGGQPNQINIIQDDDIREPNKSGSHGSLHDFVVKGGDECFEACRPEIKKSMFKEKEIFGAERESCLQCFAKRTDLSFDNSFLYPEIGKRIYKGQKCHYLCQDKPGSFSEEKRVLSNECQACVKEEFEYIRIKSNACIESAWPNEIRVVPNEMCNNKNIITTEYRKISSLFQSFVGSKPDCYEVDERTQGSLFKRKTEPVYCDPAAVVDSDRQGGKNVNTESTKSRSKSSGKTTQQ